MFDAVFCRTEAHGASQGRTHALTIHRFYPANKLGSQAATVSTMLAAITAHPEAYIDRSSNPWTVSHTRCRMPPQRCRKKAKVAANSTIRPIQEAIAPCTPA